MRINVLLLLSVIFLVGGCETSRLYSFKNETGYPLYLYPQGHYYKSLQYVVSPGGQVRINEIGECFEIVHAEFISGYKLKQEIQNYFKVYVFSLEANFVFSDNGKLYGYENGSGGKVELIESDCYPPL